MAFQWPRWRLVRTNRSQPSLIARIALALAHAVQIAHEIFGRIEHQLFMTAIDHLRRDAVLVRIRRQPHRQLLG